MRPPGSKASTTGAGGNRDSTSANGKDRRVVFVGNIPYGATEEEVRELCEVIGPVVSFRLIHDKDTGRPKGYGFCEYRDEETALSARRNQAGLLMINGRQLRIDFAAQRSAPPAIPATAAAAGPGLAPNASSLGSPPLGFEVAASAARVLASKLGAAPADPQQDAELTIHLGSFSRDHLTRVVRDMLALVRQHQAESRRVLAEFPQLRKALLQAMLMIGFVADDLQLLPQQPPPRSVPQPPPPAVAPVAAPHPAVHPAPVSQPPHVNVAPVLAPLPLAPSLFDYRANPPPGFDARQQHMNSMLDTLRRLQSPQPDQDPSRQAPLSRAVTAPAAQHEQPYGHARAPAPPLMRAGHEPYIPESPPKPAPAQQLPPEAMQPQQPPQQAPLQHEQPYARSPALHPIQSRPPPQPIVQLPHVGYHSPPHARGNMVAGSPPREPPPQMQQPPIIMTVNVREVMPPPPPQLPSSCPLLDPSHMTHPPSPTMLNPPPALQQNHPAAASPPQQNRLHPVSNLSSQAHTQPQQHTNQPAATNLPQQNRLPPVSSSASQGVTQPQQLQQIAREQHKALLQQASGLSPEQIENLLKQAYGP